jgi:PAS domain S-box-containing protein
MENLYRLLRTGDAQAQSIVDTIELPLLVLDQTFNVVSANPAFCQTFRLNGEDAIGRSLFDLGDGEWGGDELRTLLAAVIPKASAVVGYEITREFPGVGKHTMLVSARKLVQHGNHIMLLVVFEDITEQKRTDAARDILLEETRHRMKNLLAMARALATQTRAEGRSGVEYRDAFLGRLEALLTAQDLSSVPAGGSLATLVRKSLQQVSADRLHIDAAPDVTLPPRQVLPVSMILHELATNALKYGSLSSDRGSVSVRWELVPRASGNAVRLDWREEGGPTVVPPSTKGFGSRLIEFSAKRDLQGDVELRYEPEGLRATLWLPAA